MTAATNTDAGMLGHMPRVLLQLEGAVLFFSMVILYINQQGSLLLFLLLILAPDLSMLGYLANARIGSVVYNSVHIYLLPVLLLAISLATGSVLGLQIGLIWLAHIGMDRTVGYGLKYPTVFKDTHLQHV